MVRVCDVLRAKSEETVKRGASSVNSSAKQAPASLVQEVPDGDEAAGSVVDGTSGGGATEGVPSTEEALYCFIEAVVPAMVDASHRHSVSCGTSCEWLGVDMRVSELERAKKGLIMFTGLGHHIQCARCIVCHRAAHPLSVAPLVVSFHRPHLPILCHTNTQVLGKPPLD